MASMVNVADPSNDLDALLSDKAEVETCIARIGDAVFSMEGCVERLEYATTATEDDSIRDEAMKDADVVQVHAKKAKLILRDMNQTTLRIRSEPGREGEARLRRTTYNALLKALLSKMGEERAMRKRLTQTAEKKLLARANKAFPNRDQAELTEMARDDPDTLYEATMKAEADQTQAAGAIDAAYRDVETRARSVAKLQRELLEVQRIFVDLQAMVEDQGHAITTIEAHLDTATDYTERANQNVVVAIKKQKRCRRYQCYLLACVALVLIVLCSSVIGGIFASG